MIHCIYPEKKETKCSRHVKFPDSTLHHVQDVSKWHPEDVWMFFGCAVWEHSCVSYKRIYLYKTSSIKHRFVYIAKWKASLCSFLHVAIDNVFFYRMNSRWDKIRFVIFDKPKYSYAGWSSHVICRTYRCVRQCIRVQFKEPDCFELRRV